VQRKTDTFRFEFRSAYIIFYKYVMFARS